MIHPLAAFRTWAEAEQLCRTTLRQGSAQKTLFGFGAKPRAPARGRCDKVASPARRLLAACSPTSPGPGGGPPSVLHFPQRTAGSWRSG